MIQLLILFFVVVFIIAIIMLYKKYIRIKNVVDEELDRKYNNVKKAVGSNNKQIRQLKKDASELINTPNNDTNTLQEKINNNRDKIADNRAEMVGKNFQEINKVFRYESGFIVGGNAGQLRIGSDNIQLNVPNPVQVRVCNEQSCDSDSDIFTKRNIEKSIPLGINENVDSGVDESKNHNIDDNIVYSVDATGVKDNNLEFNNDTKVLSSDKKISSILFVGAIDPWGFEGGGADIKIFARDSSGMLDKGTMDNEEIDNKYSYPEWNDPASNTLVLGVHPREGSSEDFHTGKLIRFKDDSLNGMSSQEKLQLGIFTTAFAELTYILYNINISNGEVTSITSS